MRCWRKSPTAVLEARLDRQRLSVEAFHREPDPFRDLCDGRRIVEVGDRVHDGSASRLRVLRFEDAGADEDAVAAHEHHEGRIGRRRHAAGGKVDDREALDFLDFQEDLVDSLGDVVERGSREHDVRLAHGRIGSLRRPDLLQELGVAVRELRPDRHEPVVVEVLQFRDRRRHKSDVADGLDDVPGPGLALRADHGGAFPGAAHGLPEVAGPAHEGDLESPLVDVEEWICGGEDLGFVDHVDAEGLERPRLGLMSDPALRHDGDRDRVHDLLDLDRIRHPGDPAGGANVRRDALEGHDGDRAGFLGDQGLLRVRDVHDDPALLHLREAALEQFGPESEFAEVQVEGHGPPRSRPTSRWVFLCLVAELPQLRTALQWDGPPSVPIEGINGSTLSESNDTGLVDLAYLASRHVSLIQLATASIASAAGSIAILETIPSSPLFDLLFIYGTV